MEGCPVTESHLPTVPVARPWLPELPAIAPYLAEIDQRRIYSNFGPLNHRLVQRFADFFGVRDIDVVTVSNATVGLSLALMAGRRPGRRYCLFPSWNFPAGPHAAVQAGMEPYFVDVHCGSGALDLASAEEAVRRLNGLAGAMVVVLPFGAPVDPEPYEAFATRHDIDLVFDAAAAIDTVVPNPRMSVISLHATKALGAGEGGVVVSTEPAGIAKILRASNFGFARGRSVEAPALNGKMSEYHAAVGHAALDQWPRRRQQWRAVADAYRRHLGPGARLQAGWGEQWVSSTCVVDLGDADASTIVERMRDRRCETRRWWDACHRQPAFVGYPRVDLPVSERLARTVLGLPFFPDMTEELVVRVCTELGRMTSGRVSWRAA